MKHIALYILLAIPLCSFSQDIKRTQNWYFGDSAGLSFATDPPTVLTNGVMNAGEGCATISDTAGNLLFYTNGVTVWNKAHQIMENGTGLNGHVSSTQSALIVPWPGNDSLFYIFTTAAVGQANGLQYSVVNIIANNGLGKVTNAKNILLQTPVCEKLAATLHLNGRDYWVVARGYKNNNFYAYLVGEKGLIECPQVSTIGAVASSGSDAQGEIKFSSCGTILAEAVYNLSYNRVDLFSFSKNSGVVYNESHIPNITLPYSIAFSPSSNYLYVTTRLNYIYQYDIRNMISTVIKNSEHQLYFSGNTIYNYHGAIQRGFDNKLYIALFDSSFISIIQNPEKKGDSCDFMLNGLNLSMKSTFGLPNFITSYFYKPKLDFSYITNCQNDSIYFTSKGGTAHAWQIFRNKAILHTSAQATTAFNFTDTGEYIVKLVSGADTVTKTIYIEPKIELGKDTILCNQAAYTLTIPNNHRCITWQDGADSNHYTVTQSGKYRVSAYNIKGCNITDSIKITFTNLQQPVISQQGDTLYTDSSNYTYKWYYNTVPITSNTHTIKVTQNGNYSVEITDSSGCTNTSTTFLVSGLSIKVLEAVNHFNIYPIPTNNTLFIENKHNITLQSINLKDIAGRNFNYTPTNTLLLEALAKGIYYLEIIDTENNHYTTKIIIN